MSLHVAAKHLASKGRGPDTELVHMTKGELKGLQALAMAHGGSLSINPDTGLAEAGFLKNILPMVAGAAITAATGGAAAPWMLGLGYGAFETARTGDIGKGLMAGLGAYGGAGLAAGLSTAGASALGDTAASSAFDASISNQGLTGAEAAMDFSNPVAEQAASQARAAVPTTPSFANMQAGVQNVTSTPQAALNFGKQNMMNIGAAAAPVLGGAMEQPAAPGQEEYEHPYGIKRLSSGFTGYVPARPNPYYRPTGLGYAAGGDVMMASGGAYTDEPMGDVEQMAKGGMTMGQGIYKDTDEDTASLGAYDAAKKRVAKINKAANMPKNYAAKAPQVRGLGELAMAQGGQLGGYSDGGRMLKGPGDGMSDSIPAVIGKKQPARLADGEFVVPADVVSHLGNGSTDAGARKLYSMMDKIRTARTGKKKQAPAVKADKYMPA